MNSYVRTVVRLVQVDDNVEHLLREKARMQLPVKGPDGKVARLEAKGVVMLLRAKTEFPKPCMALFTDAVSC